MLARWQRALSAHSVLHTGGTQKMFARHLLKLVTMWYPVTGSIFRVEACIPCVGSLGKEGLMGAQQCRAIDDLSCRYLTRPQTDFILFP